MEYKLVPLKPFIKALNKSPRPIQDMTRKKLKFLQADPWHPSLRTKKNRSWSVYLDGDVFECSVNMNYRILFTFEDECIIVLQVLGTHDILNK